ncbi:coiled-coil domain-containing protein 50 isoform X2 [Microcaecilia unicolor]|uniref:Coiled-coil domain-containing protein 50-like isoform X2 n=1 Tax=Microcaecilia unicolor TaxID=1415580 RepID=A0A6P7WTN5_9AMPH|nr:coiled-coil domain-containing protein 50-like isoform X2 [Microcaecilia unicolor]
MTETEIDESSLHGVQEVCRDFAVLEDGALAHCLQKQEIEQHYALNIQKNKLVQKDIRIAKKLQDEEDQQSKLQCLQKRRQIEERDLAYARVIQEELQKKAEEWQQREVEDQEVARKLQELEEEAEHQDRRWSLGSRSRHRDGNRRHCRDKDPLEGQLSGLQIKNSDQLLRDEELARRLQEEEKNELATLKHQRQNEDFRAAQVAQDEEIAKYIQHQELKAHQRSQEVEFRRTSTGGVSGSERRGHTDRKAELAASHSERLNSEGLVTPTEGLIPEGSDFATEGASAERTKQPLPRNIAEALDPTFQSSQKEPSASVLGVRSQDCPVSSQPCAVPVEGFYDFLDDGNEPVFVSPTKRQPEKLGQQKSRDKKEGCKQQ